MYYILNKIFRFLRCTIKNTFKTLKGFLDNCEKN